MPPVHHVRTDGVAPMHVAPNRGVRIQLVEQVVLSLPPDRSIGIVHPIVRSEKVVLRPIGVVSRIWRRRNRAGRDSLWPPRQQSDGAGTKSCKKTPAIKYH